MNLSDRPTPRTDAVLDIRFWTAADAQDVIHQMRVLEREHAALREALSNLLLCIDNADPSTWAEDEARAILAATEPK